MTIPAASAASDVVYDPFVCLSTWSQNCPFSGRLRYVNSSSAGSSVSGFFDMVWVSRRAVISIMLLRPLLSCSHWPAQIKRGSIFEDIRVLSGFVLCEQRGGRCAVRPGAMRGEPVSGASQTTILGHGVAEHPLGNSLRAKGGGTILIR
jgi:hypothetical protein